MIGTHLTVLCYSLRVTSDPVSALWLVPVGGGRGGSLHCFLGAWGIGWNWYWQCQRVPIVLYLYSDSVLSLWTCPLLMILSFFKDHLRLLLCCTQHLTLWYCSFSKSWYFSVQIPLSYLWTEYWANVSERLFFHLWRRDHNIYLKINGQIQKR